MWIKYIDAMHRTDNVDVLWKSNVDNVHRTDTLLQKCG